MALCTETDLKDDRLKRIMFETSDRSYEEMSVFTQCPATVFGDSHMKRHIFFVAVLSHRDAPCSGGHSAVLEEPLDAGDLRGLPHAKDHSSL